MAHYAVEQYSLSIKNIKNLGNPSSKKKRTSGYEDLELSQIKENYG